MSSSEDKDVGAYTWITVILNGPASNLVVRIRELIGLYPINDFLACVPSSKPIPLVCLFSPPDQMRLPFPVQRTSEISLTSYLKRLISFLRSSNFSAPHSVCTFHVPTVKVFLTGFSLCVFPVVYLVLSSSQFFHTVVYLNSFWIHLTKNCLHSFWIGGTTGNYEELGVSELEVGGESSNND